MLVPKLRFKREDGTEYNEWKKLPLSTITEKVERKATANSTVPIMMISQGNGFIYQSDKYSRDNAGQSLARYTLLKKGEMAYNHGASKLKPYGVAYCLKEEKEARVPFVYHTFGIANGVPEFWNYSLNTSKMDRQLKKMVSSGARMDGLLNISYDTYMQTTIYIPDIEEQQKIAEFLSTVDEVIAQSEAEVQNLEQQKKAAMQKIFSQEVRFKREDGTEYPEWEEKKIGEITVQINKKTKDKLLPVYSVNNQKGFIPQVEQFEDREVASKNKTNYKIVSLNQFAYNPSRINVGSIAYLKEDINVIVSPLYIVFECLSVVKPAFIDGFVHTSLFDAQRKMNTAGSVRDSLSYEGFSDINIGVPDLEEQQKIADFLSAYDEAISYAKQELDKWKELKKGLLQQMFV